MLNYSQRIRVNRANRNPCPADWVLDSEKVGWNDFTLWLIRHGSGHIETATGEIPFREGGCILFRPHEHYRVRSNPKDQPVLAISVHFEYLDSDGATFNPPAEAIPPLYRSVNSVTFLWETLERCVSVWRRSDGADPAEAQLWLRAALAELARQDRRPIHRGLQQEQSEAIERICADIAETPGAPHTVEDMARKFRASRYHFSRIFRKLKGITPQDFIVNTRIEAAKSLLQGSSHPVQQIAELLGYRDTGFFSRQFRQKSGLSPSAYRKA